MAQSIEKPLSSTEGKVSGILWNKEEDQFVFRFNAFLAFAKSTPFTKRGLLQLIARLYDPLGLLSPLIVPLKRAFQKACVANIPWDNELPENLQADVKAWLRDLGDVGSIAFPRYSFIVDRKLIKQFIW